MSTQGMSTLTEPTALGTIVHARYMDRADLLRWVLTYPTGSPVWISGSTRCTWASLTDQQSPEVTTDPDGPPLDIDAIRAAVEGGRWSGGGGYRWDGTRKDWVHVTEDFRALLAEVDRLRATEVTTDPDGTDNSTIFDIQYPPSDPNLWDRTPEPKEPAGVLSPQRRRDLITVLSGNYVTPTDFVDRIVIPLLAEAERHGESRSWHSTPPRSPESEDVA